MPHSSLLIPIGLIGLLAGMLVNYLSDVLPRRRALVHPICLHCEVKQPLINYLFWPRRCPDCSRSRSIRVWVVEVVAVLASIWLWTSPPERLGYAAGMLLLTYFGVVVVIDLEHRLILHPVSLFGMVLGVVLGLWMNGFIPTLTGGLAGFSAMFLFYLVGIGFARMMAARRGGIEEGDALGFGDVNLSGVIGLLLGWPVVMSGLFMGIFLAAVFSLFYIASMLIARRYRMLSAIPYGPFLIAGAILLLY